MWLPPHRGARRHNIIVWEKNNHGSGDLKGAYAPKHEFVLYGHKGRSLFREKRTQDVMKFDKIHSSKLLHPTEKNIEIAYNNMIAAETSFTNGITAEDKINSLFTIKLEFDKLPPHVENYLIDMNVDYEAKKTIPKGTASKYCRDLLAQGKNIPDGISLYTYQNTKLK